VVEFQIKELEQLDSETLSLHWLVTHGSNPYGDEIASGEHTMILPGHNAAGQSIPVRATLDLLSEIPAQLLADELTLHAWVSGEDMVGHEMVSDIQFNSRNVPFASWQIQQLKAELIVEDSDLSYSRSGDVYVDDVIMVTIQVHNLGEVYGAAELTFVEVDTENERRIITAVPVVLGVDPSGVSEAHIDWVPEREGHFHIVVLMDGVEVAEGLVLTTSQPPDSGILSDLEANGFTLEWIGILGGLFILLAAVVVIAMRAGGAPEDEWFEENADATSTVENEFAGGDSQAMSAAEWATMQAGQQWTPEQIAQWQQSQAQGMQNQQQWTPEQIAWWQQQQMQQYGGQGQQGWEGYQQAQHDSYYQK
jgi:hypothetical protein